MSTPSSLSSVNVDLELLNNKITRSLLDLGLTGDEARVLLFMNKKGEMKVLEIAKNVEIPRTRLYYVLESLQSKGLVVSTIERPAKYKALPLDKAVDFLIDSYRHKLNSLETVKEVISNNWSLLQEYEVVRKPEPIEESLQIISGEDQIYSKAKDLIMKAVKEVNIFANARNLRKISHTDITYKLQLLAAIGTEVKILTNVESCEPSFFEEIKSCKIREIPPHFNDKVHFIIVDGRELLLLNSDEIKEASGVWTNSRSFVNAMRLFFTVGWSSRIV